MATHVNVNAAPISDSEKDQIKELRSHFTHETSVSDKVLLRFLRFNSHNIHATEHHLTHFLQWREDFKVEELTIADAAEFLKNEVLLITDTFDNSGRPIVLIRWKNFHPAEINVAQMLKAQAYIFELLYKLETPHPIDSFVAIADYSNWALSQSSPQLAKLTLDLARRYPFTPVTYAVSVPWYFKVVWTFAKPFMSQASVDKFSVISVDELATKVAPEHIGPELGGTLQYSVAEWISKRFKAEGLDEAHISSHSLHHQFEDALARLETTYSSIAPLAVKKGSLLKQGGGGYFGTNSWKSRVFIIGHDGCFYYFADTKAAGKPHRTYDLAGCSVELPGNEANAEKPYSFYFHSGGTQVSLAASSESDRTEWVDALNAAIKSRQEAAEAEKAASASE